MKRNVHWRILPGLLLVLFGLIGLYSGPERCQYVFLPGETDYASRLSEIETKWDGAFSEVSLHGTAENVSLTAGSQSQGEITLHEVMGSYFQVCPRRFVSGRPLSRGDAGQRVIVLDEALAFVLFRDQDPLGREVTLSETNYQVVGVAAHTHRIGETGSYAAWIPLGAENAPACTVMTLSAGGSAAGSIWTQFESGAKEVFGSGQAFFLRKERMRGTILLRAVLILLAIRLMRIWIRTESQWIRNWFREIREKLKTRYPRQMMGTLLGKTAASACLIAATAAVGAGLVVWSVQPVLMFPEWVPEVLVDPDSIAQRFRELTEAAASPLKWMTPEVAGIRFWSGMLRWGIVLTLLGALLDRRGKTEKKEGFPRSA